jgi:ABC-2 type transport system ATP-binding protein
MLHAKHLKRRFGEIQAVDDVSFSIAEGESFGLLGPNGAGKSTTIGMLIGLIAPDSGQVELAGCGAPQSPEVRRVLGIAPQSISLYDAFTAIENLTFFCRLYHLSSSAGLRHVAKRWPCFAATNDQRTLSRTRQGDGST